MRGSVLYACSMSCKYTACSMSRKYTARSRDVCPVQRQRDLKQSPKYNARFFDQHFSNESRVPRYAFMWGQVLIAEKLGLRARVIHEWLWQDNWSLSGSAPVFRVSQLLKMKLVKRVSMGQHNLARLRIFNTYMYINNTSDRAWTQNHIWAVFTFCPCGNARTKDPSKVHNNTTRTEQVTGRGS